MKEKQQDPVRTVYRFVESLGKKPGKPVYVGIDPGAQGAVALVCKDLYAVVDIPVIKVKRAGGTKSEFDKSMILQTLAPLLAFNARAKHVALEQAQVQRAGKGANAYTGYRVGVGYAIWPLFLMSHNFRVEEVHPSVWKRKMGLWGKDKAASRQKAQGMFPDAPLSRVKDEGRAEALLLAEYLRRVHRGKL